MNDNLVPRVSLLSGNEVEWMTQNRKQIHRTPVSARDGERFEIAVVHCKAAFKAEALVK